MRNKEKNNQINILWFAVVLLSFLFAFPPIVKANSVDEEPEKKEAKYELIVLSKRYGENKATKLVNGVVEYGDSKAMVYHAKGEAYLIEEPLGPMLDYEIHYYRDAVVFIEYGIVTAIKEIELKTAGIATR